MLLATALSGAFATPAIPEDLQRAEEIAAAGFVYNFAWYTSWPTNVWAASSNTVTIGVLGDDSLVQVFTQQLGNKKVEHRPVVVRRLGARPAEEPLQILFVGRNAADQWTAWQAQVKKQPVLTMSATPNFTRQGGMVQLTNLHERVAFYVDLYTARQAGLNISSRLLRLAVKVNQRSDAGEEMGPNASGTQSDD
jgi:hypothetical protein